METDDFKDFKRIFVLSQLDDFMKLLYANEFIRAAEEISRISGMLTTQLDNQLPRQEENLRDHLNEMLQLADKFKDDKGYIEEPFFSIREEIRKFLAIADVGISHANLLAGVSKILGVISASFNAHVVWIWTRRETNFFVSNSDSVLEIIKIYPDIKTDINESLLCIGMGRGTGAVAHLMRILEAAFKELSVHFSSPGINDRPSWDGKLKKLKEEIGNLPPGKDQDEFEGIYAFLGSVKEAWRNPTMHLDRTYEPEEAEEIFTLVLGSLKALVVKLPHLSVS